MFEGKKTVFILGAGASWHYGYPTGEDLVKKVIDKAIEVRDLFERSKNSVNNLLPEYVKEEGLPPHTPLNTQTLRKTWEVVIQKCQRLIDDLIHVNPPVIDYFLGQCPEHQKIGKFIIAWVMLECQKTYSDNDGNINRKIILEKSPLSSDREASIDVVVSNYKDDWVRFVLYKIVGDCKNSSDLLRNDVSFVTFNYDVSLEQKLYNGLSSIELFRKDESNIVKFLNNDRIIHIYGKIFDGSVEEYPKINFDFFDQDKLPGGYKRFYEDFQTFLNAVYSASKGLRVIPDDKHLDDELIAKASKAIFSADEVYILGYGFDEKNSGRLGINNSLLAQERERNRHVFFTNYENKNSVNKKASNVFFGAPNPNPDTGRFSSTSGPILERSFFDAKIGRRVWMVYERSILDVYQALERDFDM